MREGLRRRKTGGRMRETEHLIAHRDRLLADLVREVKDVVAQRRERERQGAAVNPLDLECLEASLLEGKRVVWTGGVLDCMDNLVNDVWWDEESEWKDADRVEVRIL